MSSTSVNGATSPHRLQRAVYNGVVLPVAYGVLSTAARFHPKLRETLAGRRNIRARWKDAASHLTDKPIWFHVASVGEYEQAKPVINRLRVDHPHLPVALTFTSPSGYRYASRQESLDAANNIKFLEYLPVDFARNARFCLDTLDPRLLVFVKFDLWPNLIWESAARGVTSVLIDATLSESSYRHSAVGRHFYQSVYSKLHDILAISRTDADRFRTCVPGHPRISVAGDTRFDRVMERKTAGQATTFHVDKERCFVIVAGSTWPKDEAHLLGALEQLARSEANLLFVLAPHEPTEDRVAGLCAWARSLSLDTRVLSDAHTTHWSRTGNQAIIVDSVGVLAEMYAIGDVTYVGGSFSSGVHSVIEPAIMGMPVLFGPVHENSFEAIELLRNDAAFAVDGADDAHARLRSLIHDDATRRDMGQRARAYVESQLGATERCMHVITQHL